MSLPSAGICVWTAFVGILVYGLYVLLRFFIRLRERNLFAKNFPNVEKHWLLGNCDKFPGPGEEFFRFMTQFVTIAPDGIVVFWLGPFIPSICVFRPETVKAILKKSEPKAPQLGWYVKPWLGDGILFSWGKKWERNRRLLNPAFQFDILRPYLDVSNRCTNLLLKKLEIFAERNEFFDVSTHIDLLTLDIILRCAFSYDNDCQLKGEDHSYVKAVTELSKTAVDRLLNPLVYPDIVFYMTSRGRQFRRNCAYVHGVVADVIKKRRDELEHRGQESIEKNRYLDFLDILLTAKDSDGQRLTEQEIRDEAVTFLFGGYDTTSSAISFALHSLAKHPELLKRCQKEVDEVLEGKQNQDIEWDDLPKLSYLTMCIKESLRLYTTVPIVQRQTTKDTTIAGRHIPAGIVINIVLYVLHHSEETWTDPEEFRPERFSPENMEKMDPCAFCPFSTGPRNCIGQHFAMQEMKTVIAKIINRFDLFLDPTREANRRFGMVMKPEDGIYMKVTPRKIE